MAREIINPIYSCTSNYVTSAIGSMSIRPSRIQKDENSESSIADELEECASSASQKTTLEILVGALQRSHLPGPAIMMGKKVYLGKGSQFIVYEQTMASPQYESFTTIQVATKQPMVKLDPNLKLNLASAKVRANLHDVYLEILALTNPRLRKHPNIARLLAWSVDYFTFHSPLSLVMELAFNDLTKHLAENGSATSFAAKYWLCRDIGAGLDALHDCGLIHGDLKPDNVLMFYDEEGFLVAKIADFGLSVGEVIPSDSMPQLFGTLGWQAPEVAKGRGLSATQLPKADNYSFGLVVWSIWLYSGKVPPTAKEDDVRQSLARKELTTVVGSVVMWSSSALPDVIYELLHEDAIERPERVEDLFRDTHEIEGCHPSETYLKNGHRSDSSGKLHAAQIQEKYMSWEIPDIPFNFVNDLYARFLDSPASISADTLFAMFLAFTLVPPEATKSENRALDVLVVSALHGYEPAQAAVPAAYEFFKLGYPEEVEKHLIGWLESAVAAGSTLAKPRLEEMDSTTCQSSLETFHSSGGYNRIFCTIDPSVNYNELGHDAGYCELHWLATYGTRFELSCYLEKHLEHDLNIFTKNRETPLYLACARGSRDVTIELLRRGASPTIKCTYFGISCMHWIFAFDEGSRNEIVLELIAHGADINAKISHEVPFLHYPFRLPLGTPLHWAVATFSHTAIEILVENGANVLIRDDSDPYIWDDRVRILNKFGGSNQEAYSFSESGTMGLSSLDLAAMQHDPFIFELLISLSKEVGINDTDEEGFTVLHRLSNTHTSRTRTDVLFSTLAFRGSEVVREAELLRTIQAIKALGGNLEQLTTSVGSISQKAQGGWDFPSYTPLMLAVLTSSSKLIRALLEAGSSVTTENQEGDTALNCLPDGKETSLECVQLLVAAGADVNHCDKLGSSPLLKAAHFFSLDLVDYFLSKGANVEERETSENSPDAMREGTSIFAFLEHEDPPFRETNDLRVAQILAKHLFSCPDDEKKRRIIDQGDADGQTLLHCFSAKGMLHCVRALVENGAPVNAIHRNYTMEHEDDVSIKVAWHETPLNSVTKTKSWRLKLMLEDKRWSRQEYENLSQRDETIIKILEGAGGKLASGEIWKSPMNDPRERAGKNRLRKALREEWEVNR